MEKTDQQIYEEFASQLCQWGENGTAPVTGNQDISYGLELQEKRLQKHHTNGVLATKRQAPARNGCHSCFFRYALYQQAGLECVSQRNGLLYGWKKMSDRRG